MKLELKPPVPRSDEYVLTLTHDELANLRKLAFASTSNVAWLRENNSGGLPSDGHYDGFEMFLKTLWFETNTFFTGRR